MGYKMTEEHKRKIAEARRRYYAEHPEAKEVLSLRHTTHGLSRRRHGAVVPVRYRMWEHAKQRAKEAGLPFALEPQDIVIPERCPLLGIKLESGTRKSHGASPSLDRIVPSLGYVKSNVWVISYRANAIKQDATLEELAMLVYNLHRAQERREAS